MSKFRTLELAKNYYQLSRDLKFPPHLKDQFLRSTSSVALNLSEGNAKMSNKEKCRFYEIAHGSFRESLTILELEKIQDPELFKIADRLGASLYNLTRAFVEKEKVGRKWNL